MKAKHNKKSIILIIVLVSILAILLVALFPFLKDIVENMNNEQELVSTINSYGFKGVLIIMGLCMLHPLFLVVPITPFQVLSGLCYGVLKGGIIVEIGYIIGNIIMFALGRQFKSLTHITHKHEKHSELMDKIEEVLLESDYPEVITAALYFIPGVPDGILPILLSQTKISFPRYLISMTIGSIPSVIIFTFCGQLFAQKNYIAAGLIVLFMLGITFVLVKKKDIVFRFLEKLKTPDSKV